MILRPRVCGVKDAGLEFEVQEGAGFTCRDTQPGLACWSGWVLAPDLPATCLTISAERLTQSSLSAEDRRTDPSAGMKEGS